MKKNNQLMIFGLLAFLPLLHINSGALAEPNQTSLDKKGESKSAEKSAKWREKMQELYRTLVEITTDSSSDQRFNAPENRSRIDRNTKKLADRAHEMSKKGFSPDADPTIKIVSQLFQDETKRAYWALKSGNRSYARSILNQVSSYCIACHTRNSSGPNFSALPLEPASKNLNSIELGRFYAATRQYDRALDQFQKVVEDTSVAAQHPLEWEQALRYGLAITVRVKNNPNQALALVEKVIGSKQAPFFMKQDAAKWKQSIIQWRDELPQRALTEEGLHVEAMQLLNQARETQRYPMDHAADVIYLRTTAVIHELLQKAPEGRYAQEALLIAGICYDALKPFSLEAMNEIYYEACIKKTPHTPTAEICYRRYEQSTYEGYTGSSGTHLPEDLKEKLRQLESLAHPPGATQPDLR